MASPSLLNSAIPECEFTPLAPVSAFSSPSGPRRPVYASRNRQTGGFRFQNRAVNAAGCGSTLKEYGELLEDDPAYADKARRFSALVKDANEFLAGIDLEPGMAPLKAVATYQDSCHLAHGQRIRAAPRKLLRAVPGLEFREMAQADLCCGGAGIYSVAHNDLAMSLLEKKMRTVNETGADIIATANPGCMIELRAGVKLFGRGQRVAHVVELLDEAYGGGSRL
jgi:glycolate oxidase iron-sulfur subunit